MGRVCYLNGQFIPESELKISAYDLSVAQGVAAFEMTRSFNGKHFKLYEHIGRLEDSCRLLNIPWPWDGQFIHQNIEKITEMNDHGPGEEHRLLIVVSPGAAPIYKEIEGTINHPFVYIADFPLRYTVAGFSKYFTEGVHCVTSPIQQVPDACVPSAAKHRSRLHFHLAQQQAPTGTWPLLQDDQGHYTEAPGANICFVTGGNVYQITPNALPGISMQTIYDDLRLQVFPGSWGGHDLHTVDELWLTGTPFCMLPVVSLDGKPIGDGKPGPVYQDTLAKWSKLVGVDIAQQIYDWDHPATLWTPDAQRTHTAQH